MARTAIGWVSTPSYGTTAVDASLFWPPEGAGVPGAGVEGAGVDADGYAVSAGSDS